MDGSAMELLRRYAAQQRESGYPDPILPEGWESAGPAAAPAALGAPASGGGPLDALRAEIDGCTRCALHERRKKLVFGVGDPRADLLFVGEGPGADEDSVGDPFVGAAGRLLDRIFAAAGIAREEVYITNVVKCRPPGNRDPELDEIATCFPVLRRQIEIIDPKIVCALGRHAAQTLLGRPEPIGRLRGVWHDWEGRRLICTYHPSACLRNADYKRPVWDDFQMLRDAYRAIRPK
ncbi:MAG: uracil-DNA glycosylase [Candidatus Latescibacterota bacterium]|nr:MAG: uracil-DNA glycosylase [Candidatus Latescibacterota bacterium]